MFLHPETLIPRGALDTFFKQLYVLAIAVNIAAFVVTFTDFYDRSKNTFTNYFQPTADFSFSVPMTLVLHNCTYNGSLFVGQKNTPATINIQSAPFHAMIVSSILYGIFVCYGVFIAMNFFALVRYLHYARNMRLGGLHVPLYPIQVSIIFGLGCLIISAIWGTLPLRQYLSSYVTYCSQQYEQANLAAFLDAEYDTATVFSLNLDFVFSAILSALGVYIVALGVYIHSALSDKGEERFVKTLFPWERGIFCRPDKTTLFEWNKRRREIHSDEHAVAHKDSIEYA